MGLKEILAAKLKNKSFPISSPLSPPKEVEEISYLGQGKYLNSFVKDDFFLAMIYVRIDRLYKTDPMVMREFTRLMLGDNIYVLNTFPRLDRDYLVHILPKPRTAKELYSIYWFISDFGLEVPDIYLRDIEERIQKTFG